MEERGGLQPCSGSGLENAVGAAGTNSAKPDHNGLLLMRGGRLRLSWQGSYGLRRFGYWCQGLGQRRLKRYRKHLIHRLREVHFHRIAQVLWNLGEVLLVVLGENDLEDARAVCSQQLFLQ